MDKLSEDIRVGILGAAAGLFAISVALLIARIDAYYAYLSWMDQTNYDEYYRGTESLWWIPVAIWHLILSITASLLAHRYLKNRLRSPFLLWQVIGISSLLGWGLTLLLLIGMDCLMSGNLYAYELMFNSPDAGMIAKYLSAAFACNVFYGSVMKACFKQYTTQFNELVSDSSTVDHLLTTHT